MKNEAVKTSDVLRPLMAFFSDDHSEEEVEEEVEEEKEDEEEELVAKKSVGLR